MGALVTVLAALVVFLSYAVGVLIREHRALRARVHKLEGDRLELWQNGASLWRNTGDLWEQIGLLNDLVREMAGAGSEEAGLVSTLIEQMQKDRELHDQLVELVAEHVHDPIPTL